MTHAETNGLANPWWTVVDKRVEPNSALHDGARADVVYKRVAIDSALSDDNGEVGGRRGDGRSLTSGSNPTAPYTTV